MSEPQGPSTGATAKVLSSPPPPDREAQARFSARDPFTVVIFGASGDLAKRKLLPALFHLEEDGFLPDKFAVVGFSRSPHSDDEYRASVESSLLEDKLKPGPKSTLVKSLYYVAGNNDDPSSFEKLERRLQEIEKERGLPGNRLYYLSVAPEFFATIVQQLAHHDMIRKRDDKTWSRVIIEKPFGRDLQSARELNKSITAVLDESQIYRIDHYLGKETVQNLFSFRFGNSIFEPLFNQKYVDNVQITVAETLGMENKRGGYYDGAGALRDMVENHLLQLLTIVAMEPPSSLDATSLRDEKVKVLRAIDPMSPQAVSHCTVRGQYGRSSSPDKRALAYLEETGVKPDSITETYVALKLHIDNWRWGGVPFYLRTGKRLKQRLSEIAVTFKAPPLHLFQQLAANGEKQAQPMPNVLLVRIQPDEGIGLTFAAKTPGMQVRLDEVRMDFFYSAFHKRSPEAYERLLLDALRGDASLFTRSDETEHAWRFISSIQDAWAAMEKPEIHTYDPFSDGPEEANRLFAGTHTRWRPLSES
ncbi:MAG: glucose-6-phosphate 1-dehydrogenase [Myxococcaceae bacterium]|nr:glucose-6-phosphate 1-dehydrogenase [Myxococcaceae bacterium]